MCTVYAAIDQTIQKKKISMFLKHLLNTYSLSYRTDKEEIVVFFIDQSENIKAPFFIMEHLRGHYNVALLILV